MTLLIFALNLLGWVADLWYGDGVKPRAMAGPAVR